MEGHNPFSVLDKNRSAFVIFPVFLCDYYDVTWAGRMFANCGRAQYNGLRMPNRVGPQFAKSSNLHITADSTGSIHKGSRQKRFS